MQEIIAGFNEYLGKDWFIFVYIFTIMIMIKLLDGKKYPRIPLTVTVQIYLLVVLWLLIFIFGLSKTIAGVTLIFLAVFIILEKLQKEINKINEFEKSFSRERP